MKTKVLFLMALLCLVVGRVEAKIYGKAIANSAPSDYGYVWISLNDNYPSSDSDWKTEDSSSKSKNTGKSASFTAIYCAKAKPGYVFVGWYDAATGGNKKSDNAQYTETLTATSTNSNSPTTITRYARFEKVVSFDYSSPAAGSYVLFNVWQQKYLKADNTVTNNISDATVFTLSGTENCTISYNDDGTTKYVYESIGNGSWGTTNDNKWTIAANNGGYYISHTDPGNTNYTRYISCNGSGIEYPRQGSGTFNAWTDNDNNNRTWQFVSVEYLIAGKYTIGETPNLDNLGFENGDFSHWTNADDHLVVTDNGNFEEHTGTYFAESWWWDSSISCSRTEIVPNGKYQISATALSEGSNNIVIFANDQETTIGESANYSVTVDVTNNTLNFGLRGSHVHANWFAIDDFKVDYLGSGDNEVSLKVNAAAKYGTFIAPFDVKVPEGVTAYSINAYSDKATGQLSTTEVGATIPANTPVLLYSENGADVKYYGAAGDDAAHRVGWLVGYNTVHASSLAETGYKNYILQNGTNGVKFYWAEDGVYTAGCNANRAYLSVPSSEALAKVLSVSFDESTTINLISDDCAEEMEYYTISGVKLNAPVKGINIVKMSNGTTKKIFK